MDAIFCQFSSIRTLTLRTLALLFKPMLKRINPESFIHETVGAKERLAVAFRFSCHVMVVCNSEQSEEAVASREFYTNSQSLWQVRRYAFYLTIERQEISSASTA